MGVSLLVDGDGRVGGMGGGEERGRGEGKVKTMRGREGR